MPKRNIELLKVTRHKIVSIHYTVCDEAGTVLDSTVGYSALEFLQGSQNILPALEQLLEGASIGEQRSILLVPSKAYGAYLPELVSTINRQSLLTHHTNVAVGEMVTMADSRTAEIIDLTEHMVVLDYNHPLAGRSLQFFVKVTAIRDASAAELLSGRPVNLTDTCGADCICYT